MAAEQFQRALKQLVTDQNYGKEVAANPNRLMEDFALTPGEMGLLAAVWEATGGTPEVQGYLSSPCCCCCILPG